MDSHCPDIGLVIASLEDNRQLIALKGATTRTMPDLVMHA